MFINITLVQKFLKTLVIVCKFSLNTICCEKNSTSKCMDVQGSGFSLARGQPKGCRASQSCIVPDLAGEP